MNIQQHDGSKSGTIDIEKLLMQLSPELRKVTVLHYFNDLPYDDVAAAMGYEKWEAKKRIFEALSILRELCGVRVVQIARSHELRYFPNFLTGPEADRWFSRLLAEIPYQPENLRLYGKQFVLKRLTAQYGNNYHYNPAAQYPRAWPPLLTELKALVQKGTRMQFASGLCNLYPDGEAYIGWHHDADHPKMIASLSLGAVRELRFAETGSNRIVRGMELAHGSLLLIPEVVNDRYKHMIPKSKHVTQPRINMTFRKFGIA